MVRRLKTWLIWTRTTVKVRKKACVRRPGLLFYLYLRRMFYFNFSAIEQFVASCRQLIDHGPVQPIEEAHTSGELGHDPSEQKLSKGCLIRNTRHFHLKIK